MEFNNIKVVGLFHWIQCNYSYAIKYYSLALEHDVKDLDTLVMLGDLHNDMDDMDNAIKYYLMAVEKGSVCAMNCLGRCYLCLEEPDYAKAVHYYLMAIAQGDVNAMRNLGAYYHQYRHHQNEEPDYAKAVHYYLMAIAQGDVNAMRNLGAYYQYEEFDYAKAIKYYLDAIQTNNDVISFENIQEINPIHIYSYIEQSSFVATEPRLVEWIQQTINTDPEVSAFANKVRIFKSLNNVHSCIVCFQKK